MSAGIKANADGSAAIQVGGSDAIAISSTGEITAIQPSGLGYGTGSGGTVTQLTSKSTTVTLNKPVGQITMNNAALAAGATAIFNCINSVINTNDICLVNSSLAGNYTVRTNCGNGTVVFVVKNDTTASLSEAVVIKFAIIKGSTS